MSKPNADVELLVTQQRAINSLQAFERRFVQMMNRVDRSATNSGKKNKSVFADIGKSMRGVALSAGSWLATMGSIYTVAGLIRSEVEATVEQQKRSAERMTSFSEVMENLRFQLGSKPSELNDMTFGEIQNAILDANVSDHTVLAQSVLGAISSDPSRPVSERVKSAIDVAESRADLQRDSTKLQPFTEAVVGQQRQFGGSAIAQQGMIAIGQQLSQVTDTESFSKYILPGVEKLKTFGFSQREGMALLSATSSAIVDKSGETTQTNTVKVIAKLFEEIRRQTGRQDIVGMDMIDLIQSDSTQGKKLREYMIGVMQEGLSPEELRQASDAGAGKVPGRSSGKVAFFNLFQAAGQGEAAGTMKDLFAKALAELPEDLAEAERQFMQKIAERNADPMFQTLNLKTKLEGLKSKLELSPEQGVRGAAIEFLTELPKLTQGTNLEGSISGFLSGLKGGDLTPIEAVQQLQDTIQNRIEVLERESAVGRVRNNGGRFGSVDIGPAEATERSMELQRMIDSLDKTNSVLLEFVAEMKAAKQPHKLAQPKRAEAEALGQ